MILPLLAVRNAGRACGFKPLNGISNRIFIERSEVGIVPVASRDSLDQINWSWDAANWLVGIAIGAGLAIHAALLYV